MDLRGMVQGMRAPFSSFAIGLILAVVLLFLILVAQFSSFVDPGLILLAVPPGLMGVLITLHLTGTTLNVQSEVGVIFPLSAKKYRPLNWKPAGSSQMPLTVARLR